MFTTRQFSSSVSQVPTERLKPLIVGPAIHPAADSARFWPRGLGGACGAVDAGLFAGNAGGNETDTVCEGSGSMAVSPPPQDVRISNPPHRQRRIPASKLQQSG